MARSQLPGRFIPRNYTRLVQSFPSYLAQKLDEQSARLLGLLLLHPVARAVATAYVTSTHELRNMT